MGKDRKISNDSKNLSPAESLYSWQEILEWTKGKMLSHFKEAVEVLSGIGTDTRGDLSGKVFFALKGDRYDAHDFLDQAVKAKASAIVLQRLPENFKEILKSVSVILVDDTLLALQSLAQKYRKTLGAKIIAITGSSGKTTTKEFTVQLLRDYRATYFSQGSFNNHWGVPLTLLGISKKAEVAVVEMGMNHAHEIERLVEIADPDIVVCTMVGSAHIEFFGTIKKIAEAKSEIYQFSRPDTVRIFNQDQDLTFDMMYPVAKKFPASRMLSFSEKNDKADVYFKTDESTKEGLVISGCIAGHWGSARASVFGRHNLTNLMAAATLAYAAGLNADQIWKAIPLCRGAWGRNQFLKTTVGAEVIFDGYNANPDSMQVLLENVALLKVAGKKIAVLGQMKELGVLSKKAHEDLGLKFGNADFSQIFFIGEDHSSFSLGLSRSNFKGKFFVEEDFNSELGAQLQNVISSGDLVVIKGSRGAKTERFVPYCFPVEWVD